MSLVLNGLITYRKGNILQNTNKVVTEKNFRNPSDAAGAVVSVMSYSVTYLCP